MMTVFVPHGSLRSQNSLTNSNMSTRRRNVWPQHKIMQRAHLYGPETREVSVSIRELHNTVSDEERSVVAIDVHLAAKTPDAHYESAEQ